MNQPVLDARTVPMSHAGAAERRSVTGFGFYLYLLSDCVLFATLFAAFAVLHRSVANGPSGPELFNLRNAFIETACLLTSSVTCGMAMLASDRRDIKAAFGSLTATFILGFAFLSLELAEFANMVANGAGPSRSAFLSSFYTLVGTHGMHVTAGLAWLVVIIVQLRSKGFSEGVLRRMFCFSLFWHVIDVVWIAVFSFIYLNGSAS
jgi:cytochrome o ubiquinol oxidase subunit III